MPERLDRVQVQLASRRERFTLTWDSREQLLDQVRERDELRGVVATFEAVGASRPVTLKPEDDDLPSISDLPAAIWELRTALADDLDDAAEGEE